MALVEPGDEVVVLEPFYDSYPPCVAMAGGSCRYVTLEYPEFALEPSRLAKAVGPRTKLIVLNTPMNPAGKVFSQEELKLIPFPFACSLRYVRELTGFAESPHQ